MKWVVLAGLIITLALFCWYGWLEKHSDPGSLDALPVGCFALISGAVTGVLIVIWVVVTLWKAS